MRALSDAVKVKPGLQWRAYHDDDRDTRARKSFTQRRISSREMFTAVSKSGRAEPSKAFDFRPGELSKTDVCPAGIRSCFGPVFLLSGPSPTFSTGICILCHYSSEVCRFLFYFAGRQNQEITLSLKRDFGLLVNVETVMEYGDF